MFERNRADLQEKLPFPVRISLDDGSVILGNFWLTRTGAIGDLLNGANAFVEFTSHEGERSYLSKEAIRTVHPVKVPNADQLKRRLRAMDGFDAYKVLGVSANADSATIRQAYLKLAKAYHPDRLADFDLPQEVFDFLTSMAKRVNAAHDELQNLCAAAAPRQMGAAS